MTNSLQTIQIWNAATGEQERVYAGHSDSLQTVTWSPDGQFLASGGGDKTIQIWQARTGICVLNRRGSWDDYYGIRALAWSPDGTRLAVGGWEETGENLQVWEAVTGKPLFSSFRSGEQGWEEEEHQPSVMAVAWSPDSNRIAAGADHLVQIWQVP